MQINKQKLIDALTKVKPGLASRELIEQTTHFCFDRRSVRTYNDQITISYPIRTPIKGVVIATLFFDLIDKFSDDELEIEVEEDQVLVSAGKTSAGVELIEEITLPKPELKDIEWNNLPEDFGEAVLFSSFSASRNIVRPELTCLDISKDQILSCDGFRATKRTMQSRLKNSFMLPAVSARVLAKYKPIEYATSNNWIHFRNEEKILFSCRTIAEEFPTQKVNSFFKVEGDVVRLPKDFQKIIDRVQVMATSEFDQDKIVVLKLSGNKAVCRGEGPYGWIEEVVRIRYKGPDIKIESHPTFLSDIFAHLNKMVIGKEVMLFEGENFKHIITLI